MATISRREFREQLLAGLPVTETEIPLAGAPTAILEGGEGPPVVLLHGPGANAAHWLRVIPGLAAARRVVAPDLPGHGESGPLGAEHASAWLAELIERTCPSPPALVGYALGGALAARFAARHGDRIRQLVLVDTLGLREFQPAPELGRALDTFMHAPGDETHDALWRLCSHDLDALQDAMGDRWAPFRAYNAAGTASDLMACAGIPAIAPGELDRIPVPTTLVWGRHDLATPLAAAEAASARHGWRLHVIEDCADDPPIERPEAFLAVLASVLDAAVGPEHPRYDALRAVFNGMIDRRPALIARCADARDVAAAIAYARRQALPLSVYGGGHNVTGNAVCDAGVTIDLRPMKRIEIDPDARTCRAGAGLTWGELDAATQAHGLAVTGGRISTTGIGGLILGGGSGWIERKCGYAVDNLLSVETVLADGRIVTASEHAHPDLFWATCGGGGNFGVVTSFELRLHPIGPDVLGGLMLYPASMAPAVLANFRDVMADAPDEVGAGVALLTAPDEPFVPEPLRGRPAAGVLLCHAGPIEDGERALAPLRAFGPPALDLVQPMPYVALQQLLDGDYPAGLRHRWTGEFLHDLPGEAIETLCDFHLAAPSPLTQILTLPGGGVLAGRDAPFNLHILSIWADPARDAENSAWTRALSAAMQPYATGRVYVNFIGDEGEERVIASFGDRYARLQALKDRYDPDNLFRTSQNIKPSTWPR